MIMSTINERFVLILNEKYGGNVSEFARQSGIPQPTLNNIVGNRMSKPSFESISKLVSSDIFFQKHQKSSHLSNITCRKLVFLLWQHLS